MRYAFALLFAMPTVAHAQTNPAIHQCDMVEQAYGSEMVDFYFTLQHNDFDHGGRIDPSFVTDINSALAEGRQFVHNEIQKIQRSEVDGGTPTVEACRNVRAIARAQIERYARYLLSEVDPRDRGLRESAKAEFRMGLQQSSRRLQGY